MSTSIATSFPSPQFVRTEHIALSTLIYLVRFIIDDILLDIIGCILNLSPLNW